MLHQPIAFTVRAGLLIVALVGVIGLSACGRDASSAAGPGQGQMPPAPVTLATVAPTDVAIREDFAARIFGAREVEVRARVSGILEERLYTEGAEVAAQTVLFRIEPEPYAIAERRAQAELADARSAYRRADREFRRLDGLFAQRAVSERERDEAASQREAAQARLALAEASLEHARLELAYTEVVAPVAGVTSRAAHSEGNLVERGALLTTIVQRDPVHVVFSLPGSHPLVSQLAQALAAPDAADEASVVAELLLADGNRYGHPGVLDFAEASIDAATGTVTARAVFPNPERQLVPGQFLRVELVTERLQDTFLLPPTAITQGPEGPSVFIVDDDHTARARPVVLGPMHDGLQVVRSGLAAGDRVVINGQVAVRDGGRVAPQEASGGER